MQCIRSIVVILGLCQLGGCESLNIRPDAAGADVVDLRQRADRAYQAGDWPAAEQAYRELVEIRPEAAEPWYRLGNVYVHLHEPKQAFSAYGQALKRRPDHARAWHNLGILQLQQATRSFVHLEQITRADDPLHRRARAIIDTVSGLLERETARDREPAAGRPDSDRSTTANQNWLEKRSPMTPLSRHD